MAEGEKEGEGTLFPGSDWEVVALTASTYTAAPGPKVFDPADESKDKEFNRSEPEPSSAIFMSGHFVFPPTEHENLPIEPDYRETRNEAGVPYVNCAEEEAESLNKTYKEDMKIKSDYDLHNRQFFHNKKSIVAHNKEFDDGKTLQELSLVGKEQGLYGVPGFSAFYAEKDMRRSQTFNKSTDIGKPNDPSHQNLATYPEFSNASTPVKKCDGSCLPCEAWWKRRATSFYSHAKEASTFWSVFVAAALMGLVILGQRDQREKLQIQHLKWQFSMDELNCVYVSFKPGPVQN